MLSWMTFFPVIGALSITFVPKDRKEIVKTVAAAAAAVPLILAVQLFMNFDRSIAGFQFVEHYEWIKSFNIEYFMGIDGLSVPMVLLTALLSFLCIIASWKIDKACKGYFALFLLLEAGMMGVFVSLDFFLFYVFWEVMLLPMYFLIGIWGGPRKEYAAIKFFLYTLAGSVLMLLAMIAFYYNVQDPVTGGHTFNMLHMMDQANHGGILDVANIRFVIWMALFIGFAIKVPIFPFHTWLPDAHVEAPTAVSVILAGVLLKMGTYGILRISYPILPDQAVNFMIPLAILGAINIIYGAFCAMAQSDMKKLVAYSSVSHMGYVLLGMAAMNSTGINGAVLQMFNHGTITAMMFLCVGVIYDRAHHRDIDGFGGLGLQMPVYTSVFSFALFAAVGLPGLSGFVSEAMVFLGAFPVHRTIAIVSALGIVIGAAYVLWMLQRVFLGPKNDKYDDLPDISARELFTLVPIGLIVLLLGVYPMPVLDLMKASLNHLIKVVAG
ncbi:NADH-quinone oxidoreductase subunit M [bacterium]|nr:NADH-quinone oxidoreductase subunit M [bacterium]MBU1074021.1 NADH-quinone oxidoreductase subunit M [bacterium]MBU1674927.1 NADH-quinone oxidoreductase subunit M [bacterium]